MFITYNLKDNIANILARFLTINDALPLGLPSSPLIANLICLDLDEALQGLADKHLARYTRYADDITISSNDILPQRKEVEDIFSQNDFCL